MVSGIILVVSRRNQGTERLPKTLRSVGKSLKAVFQISVVLRVQPLHQHHLHHPGTC